GMKQSPDQFFWSGLPIFSRGVRAGKADCARHELPRPANSAARIATENPRQRRFSAAFRRHRAWHEACGMALGNKAIRDAA
ncbi:MAG TPA: hypothetical protein VIJ72_04010, partial [Rhizomicrobium sp.]